jgi:hypothetical protein
MIKRLKWNVLHGGGGGEESDGGLTSSDDSDAGDTAAANELLAQLIANDSQLSASMGPVATVSRAVTGALVGEEASSSDGREGREDESHRKMKRRSRAEKRRLNALEADSSDEGGNSDGSSLKKGRPGRVSEMASDEELVEELYGEPAVASDADGHGAEEREGRVNDGDADDDVAEEVEVLANGGATWRECELCPGKHFLNDREVDDHVASKGHLRALSRLDKAQAERRKGYSKRRRSSVDVSSDSDSGMASKPEDRAAHKGRLGSVDGTEASAGAELGGEERRPVQNDHVSQAELKNQMRKAAVKKKLKAKKHRKWERQQAALKAGNGAVTAEEKEECVSKAKNIGNKTIARKEKKRIDVGADHPDGGVPSAQKKMRTSVAGTR